ncbi:hypothetical protein AAHC03_04788 [Spirometra sp. Aus1]
MSLEDASYSDCRISGDRSTCSSPELTCNLLPASTGVPNLGSILLSPSPLLDHPHSEGTWINTSNERFALPNTKTPNLHTGISSNSAILGVDAEIDQGRRGGPSISVLPSELLLDIFQFLPPFELIRTIPLVCRLWRRLALHPTLGRVLKVKGQTPSSVCARLINERPLLRVFRCTALKCLPYVLQDVCRLEHLQCLNMGFCDLDERAALNLARNAPVALRHLNLEGCTVIDSGFLRILVSRCKRLEALNLSHCTNVGNEGVQEITRGLPLLCRLNLDGIQWITDEALEALLEGSAVKNGILRCIWLDGFELSAAGFSNFLSRLLDIRISKIAARLGLPSVSSRRLPDSPRFLEYLRDDGPEILSISFAEYIDDSCLPHIACLASLVELALRKGRLFTSQALCDTFTLARQSKLRYLRHLDLTDCPAVNDAVVKAVCECCGPLLVALFLNWCWSVTDVGLMRILEACHSLQHLSLVGNHVIIGESFINLPTSQPHLRILNLAQCNQVLDSVLSSVAIQMRDLYIFDYFGERVGGSLDDVCQFDLARSMNKVPICEH